MKYGGGKKRKKGKWREGNIKTAKEKNDHARTNYSIVAVVFFSDTKFISVQIQPFLLAPRRLGSFAGETQPCTQASSRYSSYRGGLEPSAIVNFPDKLDR